MKHVKTYELESGKTLVVVPASEKVEILNLETLSDVAFYHLANGETRFFFGEGSETARMLEGVKESWETLEEVLHRVIREGGPRVLDSLLVKEAEKIMNGRG